jgi:hypothetical protein
MRHDEGDVERPVDLEERLRVGQVGLRETEERVDAGVVRRGERPVHQPGPGLGVGERHDDHQLVRVGHHHPLDGVVVVRGAPQDGGPWGDLDDPGQRPLGT